MFDQYHQRKITSISWSIYITDFRNKRIMSDNSDNFWIICLVASWCLKFGGQPISLCGARLHFMLHVTCGRSSVPNFNSSITKEEHEAIVFRTKPSTLKSFLHNNSQVDGGRWSFGGCWWETTIKNVFDMISYSLAINFGQNNPLFFIKIFRPILSRTFLHFTTSVSLCLVWRKKWA